MTPLACRWLYRVIERTVETSTFQAVIAPIFADLDHELQEAATSRGRGVARLRCWVALGRVLVFGGALFHAGPRRRLAVTGLGAVGATTVFSMQGDLVRYPTQFLPFLAMAVLAPFLMRRLDAKVSPGQMLVGCTMIALPMGVTFVASDGMPAVHFRGPLMSAMSACIACILTAAAVSSRGGRRALFLQRAATALLVGAGAYTIAHVAVTFWSLREFLTPSLAAAFIASSVSTSFLLTIPVALIHLPIVMAFRCRVRSHFALAVVAALTFPIPLLGVLLALGRNPFGAINAAGFVEALLPFVASAFAVGWAAVGPTPPRDLTAR